LRAAKANGVSVRRLYVEQYRQGLFPLPVNAQVLTEEKQKLKKVSGEVFGNLPALRGPVSQLTRALKMISRNISFLW
ncbi:MAG: ISLre2 family transposase, partial [Firmicutes bacterium]|nr:ISLre2 family transposase [Bacillota bacterium]